MVEQQKILILEDDSIFQKALSRALESAGFVTFSAVDGESGLRLAERERPDLIVLDLILPKKDGFEVMEYLSRHPTLAHTPVMVVTNLEGNYDIERITSLGAKGFLIKANYSLDEMVQAIKNIIGSYSAKKR